MPDFERIGLIGILLALAGCASEQPKQEAQKPVDVPPEYRLTATAKDIMDSFVDPGSDYIWDSVETVFSAKGIEEKYPQRSVRKSSDSSMTQLPYGRTPSESAFSR